MEVELVPAIVAGVVAGMVMVGLRMTMKAGGVDLRMDVARMWATMFRVEGSAAGVAGMGMHLAVSAAVGLVYASGFALLGVRDGLWSWGLVGGLIHYVIAGLVLALVPPMHPRIPEQLPAPGAFSRNLGGPDVAAFLAGHLVYGVVFGVGYAVLHSAGGTGVIGQG